MKLVPKSTTVIVKDNKVKFTFSLDTIYEIREVSTCIPQKILNTGNTFLIGDRKKTLPIIRVFVEKVDNGYKISGIKKGPESSRTEKIWEMRSIKTFSRYRNS